MLWKGGATPDDLAAADNRIIFQRQLVGLQMGLEDSFTELARMSSDPVVIMCDRGTMDGKAYMDNAEWDIMLTQIGKSEVEVRSCCSQDFFDSHAIENQRRVLNKNDFDWVDPSFIHCFTTHSHPIAESQLALQLTKHCSCGCGI
jgi:hypothetical protein